MAIRDFFIRKPEESNQEQPTLRSKVSDVVRKYAPKEVVTAMDIYNSEPAKKIRQFGLDIAKGVARAPARQITSIGLEGAASAISALTDKKIDPVYKPESKFEKFVFGQEPVEGVGLRIQKNFDKAQNITGGEGLNTPLRTGSNLAIAPFLLGAGIALDVTPFGGGSKVPKEVTEQLILRYGDDAAKVIIGKGKAFAEESLRTKPDKILSQMADDAVKTSKNYVVELTERREAARAGEKPTIGQRATDFMKLFKRKLIDSNAPIEDAIAEAQKKGGFVVLPQYDVTNQIDRVYRAPLIAGQFVKDNGLEQAIKTVDNLDEFEQYLIAKHAGKVEEYGIKTGRDLEKDKALIEAFKTKFEPQAKVVADYSKKLLDYSVDAGLISREMAEKLKTTYPDYVPLNRVFNELEQSSGQFGSKAVANLSKQTVVRKLVGSEREIESPIASLIARTAEIVTQAEKNKTASIIAGFNNLPGNPLGLQPLRTADNVKKRIEYYQSLKDAKELVEQLQVTASKSKRENKRLIAKINEASARVKSLEDDYFKELNVLSGENAADDALYFKQLADKELVDGAVENFRFIDEEKEFGYQAFKRMAARRKWMIETNIDEPALKTRLKGVVDNVDNTLFSGADDVSNDELLSMFKERYAEEKSLPEVKRGFLRQYEAQLKRTMGAEGRMSKATDKVKGKVAESNRLVHQLQMLEDDVKGLDALRSAMREEISKVRDVKKSIGQETISFFRDGIKESWVVNKDIAEAAKALNVDQLNILGRILALPVRIAKAGITQYSAPFITSNLTKDQYGTIFTSDKALKTTLANPMNFIRSLFSVLKKDEAYQDMVREGAAGTSIDVFRNQIPTSIERIRNTGTTASKIKYTLTKPSELLRFVEDVVSKSEEVTRMQQFRGMRDALIAEGRTSKDASILAAKAARENTTNFFRRGEWGTVLNSAFLYLNAGIQGSRTFIRAARKNPKAMALKLATTLYTPVAMSTAWNIADPERRKAYEDIPEYEKDGNLIYIPSNPTKDEKGRWNVIKIPLPTGISRLAIPVRRSIEAMSGLEGIDFANDVAFPLAGIISPIDLQQGAIVSGITPQAIRPTLEAATNKNFFTGQRIIPQRLEGVDPEQQVRDNTSGTARLTAKALRKSGVADVSPINVEEFTRGTFGSVGVQAMNLVDRALAGLDIIPEEQVGGQDVIDSIITRFARARGGNVDENESDDIQQILQKQKTDNLKRNQEAELLWKELRELPSEEKKAKLRAIAAENPGLAERVLDTADEEKAGLTYVERQIKQLGVENGNRANYIFEKTKGMEKETLKAYLRDLAAKKILTDEVLDQFLELRGSSNE